VGVRGPGGFGLAFSRRCSKMPPMTQGFEKCSNCGAPLESSSDGRAVRCPYCGAGGARAIDPGALAASLRSEARSVQELYETLARRFEEQFPERTVVRRSGGLFSQKRVEELVLTLDGAVFRMKRHGNGVIAERAEIVRGITLKTEILSVEVWVLSLCEGLALMAGSSAQSFEALTRIARG
jgi:uncharacterized Zn finger protein (UPF0148 family)